MQQAIVTDIHAYERKVSQVFQGYVTLSAKSSLILGENKAAFSREGHNYVVSTTFDQIIPTCVSNGASFTMVRITGSDIGD